MCACNALSYLSGELLVMNEITQPRVSVVDKRRGLRIELFKMSPKSDLIKGISEGKRKENQ